MNKNEIAVLLKAFEKLDRQNRIFVLKLAQGLTTMVPPPKVLST